MNGLFYVHNLDVILDYIKYKDNFILQVHFWENKTSLYSHYHKLQELQYNKLRNDSLN